MPNDSTARVLAGIVANALNDLALRFAFDGKQHVSERCSEYTQRARDLAAEPNAGEESSSRNEVDWDWSTLPPKQRQRAARPPVAPGPSTPVGSTTTEPASRPSPESMGAPPAVPRTAESDGAPPEGGSAVQHGGEWFDFTERPSGVWYWDSRNPKGPFIAATSREGLILTALYHAQQRIAELERMLQAERDAGDIVRASNAEMLAEIGRLEAELARLTQAGPIPDDAICMIRPHGISGMLDGTGVIEQPTRYATARWWRVTYKVPDTRLVVVDRPATAGEAKADG